MSIINLVLEKPKYQKDNMDFEPETKAAVAKPAPANKKLSESRLRLAAIQALPTVVEAEITLKEAIRGTNRTFVIHDQTVCTACVNLKPISRSQCTECKGLGYQQVERQVEVTLAAGILNGQELRHPGLGGADVRSGKNGDLLVKIKITEHPYLKLEGKNITCTLPVSLYEAVLGAEIEIPTATGKVVMKLQPLTQPGRVYRLKGLGIADGDQLVTVEVNMPQTLTKEQVQLFQKIKEASNDANPRGALIFNH
jgi:DnaJ-class molecular chaperone